MGYHKRKITKGKIGEISKIREELDELEDAQEQGCKVLALVELSDLIGAIKQYLKNHHPGYTMKDLRQMAALTGKAFKDGSRK